MSSLDKCNISRNLQSAIQILFLCLRIVAVMHFWKERLTIEKMSKLVSLFHAEFQVTAFWVLKDKDFIKVSFSSFA